MRKVAGFSRRPQPPAWNSNLLFQVGQRMQRDVGSSQLGRARVASSTCTAREEPEGLLLQGRTRNPLPAPIARASCPIHTFKGRDCSKKTHTNSSEEPKTAPLPRKKGQRGGLQHHKPHPVRINQTTKRRSSPGLTVVLVHQLFGSPTQLNCMSVSKSSCHIETHRALNFLRGNPTGPTVD